MCGDGIVADTEACDDGNDDPNDGCDANCEKTGAVGWTYTYNGDAGKDDAALGVAISPSGQVIVAGYTITGDTLQRDMLLIAIDPDGTEAWRKSIPGDAGLNDIFTDVVVGGDGTIYVSGQEETMKGVSNSIVRAFEPGGDELWSYSDPPPVADVAIVRELYVTDDGLFSIGYEGLLDAGTQLVARRHELDTGAEVWKTPAQEGTKSAIGQAVVVVGDSVIGVGFALDNNVTRPLIATFTQDGALVAIDIENSDGGAWYDAQPIGADGDLVLAGTRFPGVVTDFDVAIRRIGLDLDEKWTQTFDLGGLRDKALGVAVGPDEAIFVAGQVHKMSRLGNVFGGRYSPDGELLWTHFYDNPDIHLDDSGEAAAFGLGFVVIAGSETALGEGSNVWVRRLDLN